MLWRRDDTNTIEYSSGRFHYAQFALQHSINAIFVTFPRLCAKTCFILTSAHLQNIIIVPSNARKRHEFFHIISEGNLYSTGLIHKRPLYDSFGSRTKVSIELMFLFLLSLWIFYYKVIKYWYISVKSLPLLLCVKLNVNVLGAMWLYQLYDTTSSASQSVC